MLPRRCLMLAVVLGASPLLPLGCATEADLLTDRRSAGVTTDAALPWTAAGEPSYDAGSLLDASIYDWNALDADLDEAGLSDAEAIPYWPVCDKAGDIFNSARSGDRCGFIGGCSRWAPTCTVETAYCDDGSLLLSAVSKQRVSDDPELAICARVDGLRCCFTLWQCGSGVLFDPATAGSLCVRDCESLSWAGDGSYYDGCPDGRSDPPWPPVSRAKCLGSFVCDSAGFSLSETPAIGTLDPYGRFYFCQDNLLQLVVSGPPPWN